MQCGGCDFQHINYEKQVEIKKEILEETLQRIGKIKKNVDKAIPSENPFNYRNRVQFKFDGKNFGFYKLKTNIFTFIILILQNLLQILILIICV